MPTPRPIMEVKAVVKEAMSTKVAASPIPKEPDHDPPGR